MKDPNQGPRVLVIPLWQFLFQVLWTSVGMATLFFGPLPVLRAYRTLPGAAAPLSTLMGAALSIVLWDLSLPAAVFLFCVSLVTADLIEKQAPLRLVLGVALGMVYALCGGFLAYAYFVNHTLPSTLLATLHQQLTEAAHQLQLWPEQQYVPRLDDLLQPLSLVFLVPSMVLGLVWGNVAIASHLRWFAVDSRYSPESLREEIRLSKWYFGAFGLALALSFLLGHEAQVVAIGVVRVMSMIAFIPGCLRLSAWANRKIASQWGRTLFYVLCTIFVFYFIVCLGLISGWNKRAPQRQRAADDAP